MPAPSFTRQSGLSWSDVGQTVLELEREYTCRIEFTMGCYRPNTNMPVIRWEIVAVAYYRRGKPEQSSGQCAVAVGGGRGAATHPAAALRAAYGACEALEEARAKPKRPIQTERLPGL